MTEPGRDAREAESERVGPGPPIAPGGARRLLRLATIDIGPLRRRRDFRLLFIGQGVSFFGSMITYVAIPYQAYQLSGSSLVVGLLGLAELAPLLAAAFIGGALADAFDRRRMMQLTELLFAAASLVLSSTPSCRTRSCGCCSSCRPCSRRWTGCSGRRSTRSLPRLVERDELVAAGALSSLRMTIGMIAGPAVGGVLIATAGVPATYAVDIGHVRRLARGAAADARGAAAARGRAAQPASGSSRGCAMPRSPARAAGHLRRRHRGDVLRHADGALPGRGAATSAARACSACSTQPRRWARCWRR